MNTLKMRSISHKMLRIILYTNILHLFYLFWLITYLPLFFLTSVNVKLCCKKAYFHKPLTFSNKPWGKSKMVLTFLHKVWPCKITMNRQKNAKYLRFRDTSHNLVYKYTTFFSLLQVPIFTSCGFSRFS